MDEKTEVTLTDESVADLDADFDSAFDGETAAAGAEEAASEEAQEVTESEAEAGEESESTSPDDPKGGEERQTEAGPAEAAAQSERFILKHLDEIREATREETITLAQKGMDYDRIRKRADGYEEFLREMALGRPLEEFMDTVRAEKLAREQGIDKVNALERVRLEREKKTLAADRAERDTKSKEEENRRKSFEEFTREFPDVKAQEIPKEVWQDFSRGVSLVNAYARYENRLLKQQLKTLEKERETLRQNEKNRERTAGSRQTAGKKRESDPFDDGWGEWD